MKICVTLIFVLISSSLITSQNHTIDISTSLKALLLSNDKENLIEEVNTLLTMLSSKPEEDVNLDFSEKETKQAKLNLAESYKKTYKEYYLKHYLNSKEEKGIQNGLYESVQMIIEYYNKQKSKYRLNLLLNEFSSKTLDQYEKEAQDRLRLEKDSSNNEKKRNNGQSIKNPEMNIEKQNLYPTTSYLLNDKVKSRRSFFQKKNQRSKLRIRTTNEKYIEKFIAGKSARYTTFDNLVDYTVNAVFLPNCIYDQAYHGTCYSAAASMLFSYWINIALKRRGGSYIFQIPTPLDFVFIAACASDDAIDEISTEEKEELALFKYGIYSNYGWNWGRHFGSAGATAIFIKYHLDNNFLMKGHLFEKTYESRMKNYYSGESFELYSKHKSIFQIASARDVCFAKKEVHDKEIESFGMFSKLLKPIQKNFDIRPVDKSNFSSVKALKRFLLEHGPFIFRIEFSQKAKKLFSLYLPRNEGQTRYIKIISEIECNDGSQMFTFEQHYIIAMGILKVEDFYVLKFKNSYGNFWGLDGYGYLMLDDEGSSCFYKRSSSDSIGTVSISLK